MNSFRRTEFANDFLQSFDTPFQKKRKKARFLKSANEHCCAVLVNTKEAFTLAQRSSAQVMCEQRTIMRTLTGERDLRICD